MALTIQIAKLIIKNKITMKTLKEIYENYAGPDGWGDKGTAHTYIDEYAKLLEPYRKNSTVLEIGIAFGHSMEMWCDYFIDSDIIGVDIQDHGIPIDTRYKKIWCDATSESVIPFIENYKFDVIIDDGSHDPKDQIKSFELLKNYMSKGGIYVIEDIHTLDIITEFFANSENSSYDVEIIDNRHKQNRYDDILVVIKNFK